MPTDIAAVGNERRVFVQRAGARDRTLVRVWGKASADNDRLTTAVIQM